MSSPVVNTQGVAYGVFILYVCFSKEMPENIIFVILLLQKRTKHLASVMSHIKESFFSLKSLNVKSNGAIITGSTFCRWSF